MCNTATSHRCLYTAVISTSGCTPQAADNLPLYGVCCYMEEMLHRPPALLASKYPDSTQPLSRYLVAAPRCYAFLTHFPFFALHMKVGACNPPDACQLHLAPPLPLPGRRHMLRRIF
jgi:hypothetical protein